VDRANRWRWTSRAEPLLYWGMSLSIRPTTDEYPPFYHGYVEKAAGTDLLEALHIAQDRFHDVLNSVTEAKAGFRYAPDKWSIKEVVQHVIDCERIFTYRALRFARKDTTALPGYEENDYAPASEADRHTLRALVHEHDVVRSSSLLMFQSLPPASLERSGISNGRHISVRALGWVIAGHSNHHATVISERYLTHN
jgi:hypothetical protein